MSFMMLRRSYGKAALSGNIGQGWQASRTHHCTDAGDQIAHELLLGFVVGVRPARILDPQGMLAGRALINDDADEPTTPRKSDLSSASRFGVDLTQLLSYKTVKNQVQLQKGGVEKKGPHP